MSMVCKNRDRPHRKKAMVVKLMGKVMGVVFMDSSDVILVHMVPAGHTVKGAFAWKTRSRGDQIRYSNCVVCQNKDNTQVLMEISTCYPSNKNGESRPYCITVQ